MVFEPLLLPWLTGQEKPLLKLKKPADSGSHSQHRQWIRALRSSWRMEQFHPALMNVLTDIQRPNIDWPRIWSLLPNILWSRVKTNSSVLPKFLKNNMRLESFASVPAMMKPHKTGLCPRLIDKAIAEFAYGRQFHCALNFLMPRPIWLELPHLRLLDAKL